MSYIDVPNIADGELIQTAWGNAVADDLDYFNSKLPKGLVARGSNNSGAAITATEADVVSVTFTAVANRIYEVSMIMHIFNQGVPSANMTAKITDGANTSLLVMLQTVANGWAVMVGFVTLTPTAGAYTVKSRISTPASSVSLQGSMHQLVVKDIGST